MKTEDLKHKAFSASGFLALVFAGAAHLEWVGYKYFDRPDGSNLLCSIDPACRPLTVDERLLSKTYLGSRIDTGNVKIFSRPFMGLSASHGVASAPNGNIYVTNEDYRTDNFATAFDLGRRKFFIHEMVHVAQHQMGMNLPYAAVKEWARHTFDYKSAYDYNIDTANGYGKLNLEQQARIMEDYFYLRNNSEPSATPPLQHSIYGHAGPSFYKENLARQCAQLKSYETKIREIFPVTPHPACPG